jgi:hypothetical protein
MKACDLTSAERLALVGKLDRIADMLPPKEAEDARLAANVLAFQEARLTQVRAAVA